MVLSAAFVKHSPEALYHFLQHSSCHNRWVVSLIQDHFFLFHIGSHPLPSSGLILHYQPWLSPSIKSHFARSFPISTWILHLTKPTFVKNFNPTSHVFLVKTHYHFSLLQPSPSTHTKESILYVHGWWHQVTFLRWTSLGRGREWLDHTVPSILWMKTRYERWLNQGHTAIFHNDIKS